MAGTLVANTINTDTGLFSTNNAYLGIAKAWAQFNGTAGTVTTGFNVSSVTHVSTGLYQINFSTAMPTANYAVVSAVSTNTVVVQVVSQATGNYQIRSLNLVGSLTDDSNMQTTVFSN